MRILIKKSARIFKNLEIFYAFSDEKRGYPYDFLTFRNLMGGIPPGSAHGGDHSGADRALSVEGGHNPK